MQIIEEPPLSADLIRQRAERLIARLRGAAEAGGHDPTRLRIVAVTKTWPAGVCRMALDAGLSLLGENRVQEAEPKIAELPDADWHLVGRLQSNKARRAVRLFSTVHSVDSLDLLRRLDALAQEEERTLRVLLQVNLSGEVEKAGFDADWFADQARRAAELARTLGEVRFAEPVGLMTMGQLGAPEAEARVTFGHLRTLRDELEETSGRRLPDLSMGMTADAEAAVAEGATLVRIGTALFGPRPEQHAHDHDHHAAPGA